MPDHPAIARTPLGRLVTMAEIVDATDFLLTNTGVSAIDLIIDGGLRRDKAVVHPPAGPGLGVRISDEFLRKHRFDETRTREMEGEALTSPRDGHARPERSARGGLEIPRRAFGIGRVEDRRNGDDDAGAGRDHRGDVS
jgi:hypothetical protein